MAMATMFGALSSLRNPYSAGPLRPQPREYGRIQDPMPVPRTNFPGVPRVPGGGRLQDPMPVPRTDFPGVPRTGPLAPVPGPVSQVGYRPSTGSYTPSPGPIPSGFPTWGVPDLWPASKGRRPSLWTPDMSGYALNPYR